MNDDWWLVFVAPKTKKNKEKDWGLRISRRMQATGKREREKKENKKKEKEKEKKKQEAGSRFPVHS